MTNVVLVYSTLYSSTSIIEKIKHLLQNLQEVIIISNRMQIDSDIKKTYYLGDYKSLIDNINTPFNKINYAIFVKNKEESTDNFDLRYKQCKTAKIPIKIIEI